MKSKLQHSLCVKILKEIEYIFSKEEVIVIGDGQIVRNIVDILSQCKTKGLYGDIKISNYVVCGKEGDSLIEKLSLCDNKDKAIVVCNEIERFGRKWISLIKSGFERIINGIELINAGYFEIYFHINTYEYDIDEDLEDNKFVLDSKIKEKLNQREPYEGFIMAAEEHKRNGNYLLAYDYYYMAYKEKNSIEVRLKLSDLRKKIDFTTLTDYEIVNSLQKIISLNFYGRSGSIYCGALLEGHSKILTLPSGIVYSPYIKIYSLFFRNRGNVSIDEIIEELCDFSMKIKDEFSECISIKTNKNDIFYPEKYEENMKITLKKLLNEECTKEHGVISEAFLYRALVYSHSKALGRQIDLESGVPYILDQQHDNNGKVMLKFINFFEYNRVLLTVRNICQNIGSMMEMMERQKLYLPQKIINLFKYFAFNSNLINLSRKHYVFFVQIEKINISSKETLKKLCSILYIEYEQILAQPSLNGYKFYDSYGDGKFYYGSRKSGINKKYDKYFSDNDRLRLEKMYFPLLCAMGYIENNVEFENIDWELDFCFFKRLIFCNDKDEEKYRNYIKRICKEILDRKKEIENYLSNTEVI